MLCLAACSARPANGSDPQGQALPKGSLAFDSRLWRAARETIDFLPLASTDPLGGRIETEWGVPRGGTGRDRYRIKVEIEYRESYDRAVAVAVRHEVRSGDGWLEVEPEGIIAVQLARQIGEEAGELRPVDGLR